MRDVAEMDNSKGDVVIGSKSALSAENRSKLELVEIWIDQAELQLKQVALLIAVNAGVYHQ